MNPGWGLGLLWGRTGRVVLWGEDADVVVDNRRVGWVGERSDGWLASTDIYGWANGPRCDSRDEAVMWVLRRARPDAWREERPVVWKVWTHPRPADPFGPAGWQWLGGPDKDTTMLWAGPQTGRGQREWIIKNAHYRAVCDYERQRAS